MTPVVLYSRVSINIGVKLGVIVATFPPWIPPEQTPPRRKLPKKGSVRDFVKRTKKHPFYGCRFWLGARTANGYGYLYWEGKMQAAHRVAYTIVNGPIPKGLFICHLCNRPACVAPKHLVAETPAWNMDHYHRTRRSYRR